MVVAGLSIAKLGLNRISCSERRLGANGTADMMEFNREVNWARQRETQNHLGRCRRIARKRLKAKHNVALY